MTDTITAARPVAMDAPPAAASDRLGNEVARRFLSACEGVAHGSLTIITPEGHRHRFGTGRPEAEMEIHDWSAIAAFAARGDIGLGEAYIDGLWDSPDIDALTQLAFANEDAFAGHLHGSLWNRAMFLVTDRLMRRNSRRGSARNIKAHYDVGNDFYRLWLDESMTYSSALFDRGSDSLETAQARKYQRLLDATAAGDGRTLEIGCGWGGFAEAAANDGRDLTAITISPAQKAFAEARLGGRGRIDLRDYRDVQGKFDSIVSIEMIEAVGERYWPTYFKKIKSSLFGFGPVQVEGVEKQ